MSDDTAITHQVISLLTERLGIPPEEITPSAELAEDLGVDSVDAVTFALALEREFKVSLPDELFGAVRTVQDVIDIVRERSGQLAAVAPECVKSPA
jgi:acyl carrier protein